VSVSRRHRHAPEPPSGLLGPASPRASRFYRGIIVASRTVGWLLRFRYVLEGAEHLPKTADGKPAGAWIAAGVPHRTWIDPFVVALQLPVEPRLHYLGDGPMIFRSRLRRFVLTRMGGVIPIWSRSGPRGFAEHIAAAEQVIAAGGVFTIFPETGTAAPLGQARTLSPGVAYFALRTGAPIVPLILGGTHELYLGRRFVLRVLVPVTARELAGLPADAPLPERGTLAERDLARRITAALAELVEGPVADVHAAAEPPPGTRKRWRWLTTAAH
jgi:1-acyl-sn-glycerol-3-phosphate acyltransferase